MGGVRAVDLPVGVVTLLFSDIEDSTRLLQELGNLYGDLLSEHHQLLREIWAKHGGVEVNTDGDAFFVAFSDPERAATAAVEAQRDLTAHTWPGGATVRVRMGIHTGTPRIRDGTYWGIDVHYAARVCAAANGGQVLLSSSTAPLIAREVEDLGQHALKGFPAARTPFHLRIDGRGSDQFAPVRTLRAGQTNLPAMLSTFVGRERELEEVCALVGATRLVTLVGAGGVGKSRLASAAATRLLDGVGDGVWLVELAALSDPESVAREVAKVLKVTEHPGQQLLESLVDALADRELLLVLDNCEHLIEPVAELAAGLLARCPSVIVLASSREPLRVAGEQVYRVPSLSMPPPGDPHLEEYGAVQLFVERARDHRPGFAIDERNAGAVAAVARRLDGIPLAIELATARLRSLGIGELQSRLEQSFRLLTGGSRTDLPRQQTLAALIEWSYELLSERERTVLAHLSVFVGGFDLEAAEAVCAGGDVDDLDVIDLLAALVDKSLVQVDDIAHSLRYRLLETVREYAAGKLARGGERTLGGVQRAHRDHYLKLAETASPQLEGRDQVTWLERLETEHDNLRAALSFSLGDPDAQPGLRLASALRVFWRSQGYGSEGADAIRAQLDRPEARELTPSRAIALASAASIFAETGGNMRLAEAYGEEAIRIARAAGGDREASEAMNQLGGVRMRQGREAEALELTREAVAIARRTDDPILLANTLQNHGWALVQAGADFRATHEELVRLQRQAGNRAGVATALQMSGLAALDTGDIAGARADLEETARLADEVGSPQLKLYALVNLGLVAYFEGNDPPARALFIDALAIARDSDTSTIPYALLGLALTMPDTDPERTAELHGAVDWLLEQAGDRLERLEAKLHQQDQRRLTAVLGIQRFQDAHAGGRGRPLDELISGIEAPSEASPARRAIGA